MHDKLVLAKIPFPALVRRTNKAPIFCNQTKMIRLVNLKKELSAFLAGLLSPGVIIAGSSSVGNWIAYNQPYTGSARFFPVQHTAKGEVHVRMRLHTDAGQLADLLSYTSMLVSSRVSGSDI